MKKLILIILLLSNLAFSQYYVPNGINWGSAKQGFIIKQSSNNHDTTRLFAQMVNLTQADKTGIRNLIQDLKDTVAYYKSIEVNDLKDIMCYMFVGAINDSDNIYIDWTGQWTFTKVRYPKFTPYVGAWSDNNDSAYISTNFRLSDIPQKTKFSILTLVRNKHDLTYSDGDNQYEFGRAMFGDSVKVMGLSWNVNGFFIALMGEHTTVGSNWFPCMTFGTRSGTEIGNDSLWLFYNGFRVPATQSQQTPSDTVIEVDSTLDILACNFSTSKRSIHKHFSTRKLAYHIIFNIDIPSDCALAVARCFYKYDKYNGVVNDYQADSLFARMPNLPDSDKVGINELITNIKDSLQTPTLANYFNVFCIAMNNEEYSLMNWVKDTIVATNVNGCTFTPYQGFQTTSSDSKYINTNYNSYPNLYPAWNTACFGCISYTQSDSAVAGFDMGASTAIGTYIGARWTADKCYWKLINYVKNSQSATKTKGILGVNTAGLSSMSYYVNDSIIETNTATRAPLMSDNLAFFVGCDNVAGTPTYYTGREYMGWWFGKEMTALQYRGFVNSIKLYFARKGKTI